MVRKSISDKPYLAWLHTLPCAVEGSGCAGPVQAHHVRRLGERRDDSRAVPLCAGHHLHDWGRFSIHWLGRRAWQEYFGVDLEALIVRLRGAWGLVQRVAA